MKTHKRGLVLNVQNQYKDIAQDKIETNTMLQLIHPLTKSHW